MALIHLVRHGEPAAAWGEAADPGLSVRGLDQARAAAATLAGFGRVGRIISSPLARCRQTAEPLCSHLGVAMEIDEAVAEVRAPAGVDRRIWLADALAGTWAQASLSDWRALVTGFLLTLPSDAVVFSHFVAINAAVSQALGRDETVVFRPGHASITTLETSANGLSLVRLGAEMESQVL